MPVTKMIAVLELEMMRKKTTIRLILQDTFWIHPSSVANTE